MRNPFSTFLEPSYFCVRFTQMGLLCPSQSQAVTPSWSQAVLGLWSQAATTVWSQVALALWSQAVTPFPLRHVDLDYPISLLLGYRSKWTQWNEQATMRVRVCLSMSVCVCIWVFMCVCACDTLLSATNLDLLHDHIGQFVHGITCKPVPKTTISEHFIIIPFSRK